MLFRKNEPETPKTSPELDEIRTALEKAKLPEVAAQVARKELERLDKMDPGLPEYIDRAQLSGPVGLPPLGALHRR